MFTGLIECLGVVLNNQQENRGSQLTIESSLVALNIGESIAVNGVCLTLKASEGRQLAFDVSPETLQLTTLGDLKQGDFVNLERAMPVQGRFGGHYVSGHVDTTASIKSKRVLGAYVEMIVHQFALPSALFLVPKGSITLQGVSLTINTVTNDAVSVMLVPQTLEVTTLGFLEEAQRLNVEFDYLTRIVAHQLKVIGVSA